MGDHFVLLVDRLLTESTLEAAIGSRNPLKQAVPLMINDSIIDCSSHKDSEASLSPRKLVECRICQDEDVDSNMESPCSCSGSLKQFKPGYTAPPPIFRFGGLPMNLRGNWQISRSDPNNPRIIAMVSTDHSFIDQDYDEYAVSTSRSIVCCRSVAIILLMLRIIGIILPICIILKAVTSILRRQHQQANLSASTSDEESSSLSRHQRQAVATH
ncbi:UNVERIFIED_CONTAM: hypothetical protein Sindi_1514000 [Sesamum indicum]